MEAIAMSTLAEKIDLSIIPKVLFSSTLGFGLSMWYLCSSSTTSIWTALLVSLVFTLVFTIGFTFSIHFRCSVFVWVVQLFGLFGCFNLFIFASWLTILDTIEDIVSDRVALAQSTCFLNNTNSTLNTEGFDTETLADLVAALHYTLPTPFICVFIYSFFYEYTFFERDASKSKQQDDTLNVAEHSGEQSPKQKLREYFLNLALHCACGVIGSVVMLVYCVVCMKVIFHDPIFQSFSASCYKRQNAGDQYMKLIPYTIVSVAICIVSFFSEKILTIRQSIIAKFFKDQSEECNSAADNKTRVVARGTQNRKNGTTSSKK